MISKTESKKETGEGEYVVTRVLNAPRKLVWKAFNEPRRMAQWWGPHGFTNPVCEMDVRPGGAYRIVMHSPDGVDYPMKGAYREVVEPERLTMTGDTSEHPAEWHDLLKKNLKGGGKPASEFLWTATFAEQGGKTKLTIRMLFESVMVRDAFLKMGMNEGWSQSLERLESLLAKDRPGGEFVSTRVIDAPRELVFKAWTDPKHLAKWWGPKGFTNTFHEFDLRPGGVWRFVMHGPDGVDYQNKSVFVEIVKPERIVFNHVSGPQFQVAATFAEQGRKTRVTFRMLFDTVAECDKVKSFVPEANEENLDRLEAELAQMAR